MKKRLAICDPDERYCHSMQNYLLKRLTDFEVFTFTSLQEAAEHSRKQAFSLLLLDEYIYEEDLSDIQALQIMVLREDGEKQITKYPYLEKYQSMEIIIPELLKEYAEHMLMDTSVYQCRKKTRIHSFYSPVRQNMQTKASFVLGQLLSKDEKKVLYLNLQAFTGIQELQIDSNLADITDLLYIAERQEGNLFYQIQGMKQTCAGVDYFLPATDFMDLVRVSEEEWTRFMQSLTELGEYTDIILDISEICQGLYGILEKSDKIYSICGMTREEQLAIEQYKRLMEKRELTNVLERTYWLELPPENAERRTMIEQLDRTPLGEYMKGRIKENGSRPL